MPLLDEKASGYAVVEEKKMAKLIGNKRSRNFLRTFRAKKSRFSRVFQGFRTRSDLFGSIRIHSDAFGCIWMLSDAFGHFRKISKIWKHIQIFFSFGWEALPPRPPRFWLGGKASPDPALDYPSSSISLQLCKAKLFTSSSPNLFTRSC